MRSTCETCDRAIPSPRTQCGFCNGEDVRQFSTDSNGARDESWSYGRVVLTLVPASNRYLAAALGSAAFEFASPLVDSPHVLHSDVQAIYDFDTAPASTLTSDWECDLPSTVRLDTDHGQQLLETAIAKTDDGPVDSTSTHLFGVEGTPLGSSDEFDHLVEADESYWLVSGIVRRYSAPLPDGPTRTLDCDCRSLATPHVYTGRGGAPRPYHEPTRPIWICRCCRRPTSGPEPNR